MFELVSRGRSHSKHVQQHVHAVAIFSLLHSFHFKPFLAGMASWLAGLWDLWGVCEHFNWNIIMSAQAPLALQW